MDFIFYFKACLFVNIYVIFTYVTYVTERD